MHKVILTPAEVEALVRENKYKVEENSPRAASSFPGTPQKELEIVTRTANEYGFEIDEEKVKAAVEGYFPKKQPQASFEGAVLIVEGDYSVGPNFTIPTAGGDRQFEVFIFHREGTNRMHKKLSKELLTEKIVTLFPGCDEEYLYEVLSETTDTELLATIAEKSQGLPLYIVTFKKDGQFEITQ